MEQSGSGNLFPFVVRETSLDFVVVLKTAGASCKQQYAMAEKEYDALVFHKVFILKG